MRVTSVDRQGRPRSTVAVAGRGRRVLVMLSLAGQLVMDGASLVRRCLVAGARLLAIAVVVQSPANQLAIESGLVAMEALGRIASRSFQSAVWPVLSVLGARALKHLVGVGHAVRWPR